MGFLMYDLILLGIFIIIIGLFLYKRKKEIKKEGLLLLYKTSWGVKLIDKVGKKFPKTLGVLSYVSVGLGYLLMIGMLWLLYTIIEIYVLRPDVVALIKVPPIMPLIPYIDKVVPFLPPFYFTYWIIILAVIAIPHEFAHGIFMRRYGIKIKSTGFGFFPFFLPIFLAAFVEQDEKSMTKAKNFQQRAVLSAGTFANVLTAILFFFILWGFFSASFAPAGVSFDDYSYSIVDISEITMVNGVAFNVSLIPNDRAPMDVLAGMVKDSGFNEITANGKNYVGIKGFSSKGDQIALYDDAPAIESNLSGPILEINGKNIQSIDKLSSELSKYSPGEVIEVTTKVDDEDKTINITLGENPSNENKAWLGIVFLKKGGGSLMNQIVLTMSSFKKSNIYYEPVIASELMWFIYYLLWWLILISISVALINMLPMGIFDGGRFFYLTVLAITKNQKFAERSFKWLTYFFLLLVLILMVFWAAALF